MKDEQDPAEMPALDPRKLTQAQRAEIFTPKTDDIEFSKQFRGAANQIGAIFQRRYTDAFGRRPRPSDFMGGAMEFIAICIGRDPRSVVDYVPSPRTLEKQQPKIDESMGYRRFNSEASKELGAWLYDQARSNNDRERLLKLARHKLQSDRILPGSWTLLRIIRRSQANAEKWTYETLAHQLNGTGRESLDHLLTIPPEARESRFEWLKEAVGVSTPKPSGLCSTRSI